MNQYVNNSTCLVVSHNRSEREIFGRALDEISPQTVYCTAKNGKEALEMITRGRLIPDIIFVELDMPGMDGIEFLKRLRSRPLFNGISVIVHTKSLQPSKQLEIFEAGAMAIYSKDYEYEGVYNILHLYCFPPLALFHPN